MNMSAYNEIVLACSHLLKFELNRLESYMRISNCTRMYFKFKSECKFTQWTPHYQWIY